METQSITTISKTKTIMVCCLIAFLIACTVSCFGQDTILTNSGTKILSKVIEISSTEIKYKKVENQEGPLYVIKKNEVNIIKYSNGFIDTIKSEKPWLLPVSKTEQIPALKKYPELKKIGRRYWYGDKILSETEMQDVLLYMNNPKITGHIKMAKKNKGWQYIGFAAIPFGIASIYCYGMQNGGLYNSQRNDKYYSDQSKVWALLAAACLTTSITLKVKRNQHNAIALKLYQQNY